MAHLRQQLRDKLKPLLEQATGRPVFVNRSKQISPHDLPCLLLTTDSDAVDLQTLDSQRRDITLTLRVFQKSFQDADNQIDDLCVDIENALSGPVSIQWDDIQLLTTEINLFGDGDQPIATAKMHYRVTFFGVTNPEHTI